MLSFNIFEYSEEEYDVYLFLSDLVMWRKRLDSEIKHLSELQFDESRLKLA